MLLSTRRIMLLGIAGILLTACNFAYPDITATVAVNTETSIFNNVTQTTRQLSTLTLESSSVTPSPSSYLFEATLTPTMTSTQPVPIPVATSTPTPHYLYSLQPGSPKPLPNIFHTEKGCNWMGIGGQVFDANQVPVENLVIQLEGTLAEKRISSLTLTGGVEDIGPGGFEFSVADYPIESSGTLHLTVFNLSGVQLTDDIYLTTYKDCDKNFILVNLSEFFPLYQHQFLPVIQK